MTSRQLFWVLPVSAVVLILATLWEQSRRRPGGDRPEVQVDTVQQSVGPELQFELYDSRNRTVRLSRYLGRHRVDVVFLATGASVNDDPVVKAVGQPSLSRVILVVSQQLPQLIRRELAGQPEGGVVVLSDAGGRMGQSPGAAARAWGAMGDGETVDTTRWYVIDRAGRVDWAVGRPVSRTIRGKTLDPEIPGQSEQ
mgnify:CR=1 FL=1